MKIAKIKDVYTKTLEIPYTSLVVPSFIHAYSICVEKMKQWFLKGFKDDYFTSVNIEGAHSLDKLRGLDQVTVLKRKCPALYIQPTIDVGYNRDNLYLYQFGAESNIYNGRVDRAFFKDYKHNCFISVEWEELAVSINYKMKVSTEAQQLDAIRFIQLYHRIGATETLNFDMDIHIPYNLILQLALDTGFKVIPDTDTIENVIQFISYLNQNSLYPFLYKYRCINGKNEFFVRIPNVNMHLMMTDGISKDNGERVDQLTKDYGIEFTVNVNMMAPKFYAYHSRNQHTIIEKGGYIESDDNIYTLNSIILPDVDKFDEHGWNQYLQTEYESDGTGYPLCIDLKDLFYNSDIECILKHTIASGLSPAIFLNFRVYNNGIRQDIDVDYVNLIIHTKCPALSCISNIFIYANLEYINEQLILLRNMNNGRTS